MNKILVFVSALLGHSLGLSAQGALIISQYVETNAGSTPKGIELWNSGTTAIDFSVTSLDIQQGTNGGALSSVFTLATGSLGAGSVMVVGTADMGTYLESTYGVGVVQYHLEPFVFNGDDALQILLGGGVEDTFGTPGVDPGTAWTGGGVSTANSNIELKPGITSGAIGGFTDPSERFATVSATPATLPDGLTGFGLAPVPEPSIAGFLGLSAMALLLRRRPRR